MSGGPSKLHIQQGIKSVPVRACFYGPSGVGKTTLASSCPDPLFLDFERGSHHLDVARITPEKWSEVDGIIKGLLTEPHPYKSLVIDTADWAEKLLVADICQKHSKSSIEEFGYGKGYTIVAEAFAGFLSSLEALRQRGMHLVFVAHSQIRKFEQPDQTGSYDRYELKLNKQTAPLLKEWCDMLLFCAYETKVVELDGKKKGIGGRERLLFTSHTASWDAKNRQGFPERLPFGFAGIAPAFRPAAKQAPTKPKPAKISTPPPAPTPSTDGPNPQQLQNIQTLWKQLGYGQAEMTKLFAWLEAEALEGAEQWTDLSHSQAAKAVGFLSKKASEKGGAQ